MSELSDTVGAIFAVIGIIIFVALLLAFPTYWLWNWLMPAIFGLKEITLFQALGLNLLCSILFKSSTSSKK